MFKQVLLASVAAMGMFAYATQSSQVSATDSPNVVDILPANPTERAWVLDAQTYGVDHAIRPLEHVMNGYPDKQVWVLHDEKGGFWFDSNENTVGITGYKDVDGVKVPMDPIHVYGNPDATTVDAAIQAVHLYCD
ncbi:hypothetical protein [Weissella confusa]|uniref:hypothetical protein n=1 Tax=Weissella confusa TaxID=1583 RepID=UPI0022FDF980|nr:hypothetical protein [Weissella confusa]MDA5457820.1 hypothetical protein [Weissella confusa]